VGGLEYWLVLDDASEGEREGRVGGGVGGGVDCGLLE